MPQKKFKFLNSEMLVFIDNKVEDMLGSMAAANSKTQYKNTIKKVYDELGRDPRVSMEEDDELLSTLISETITKITQPSPATIKQTGRKCVDFIKRIKEDEIEANKTEEERAFESYMKSEAAKKKFYEEYAIKKIDVYSGGDEVSDLEDEESEEETKEIMKQQSKKRRKT